MNFNGGLNIEKVPLMLIIIMMNTLSMTDPSLFVTEQNALLEVAEQMPSDLMPDWAYTATAAVLFLIGFFGFFLNLFVIVLMCKDIKVSGI